MGSKQNSDIAAILSTAQSLFQSGQVVAAEELVKQALEKDCLDLQALCFGAYVAATLGEPKLAIDRYRLAISNPICGWEPHYALSQLLLNAGDPYEAVAIGQKACERYPTVARIFSVLGQAYLSTWDYPRALAAYERAIDIQPNYGAAYHGRGLVLRQLGRDVEAEAAFRSAAALEPGAPPPLLQLTKLLLDSGRNTQAQESLEAALNLGRGEPQWQMVIVAGLVEIGLYAEAEAPLQEIAEAAGPDSSEALNMLGRVLQQLGRFQEANACFEKLIRQFPKMPRPYFDWALSRKATEEDRPQLRSIEELLGSRELLPPERRELHYAAGKLRDDFGEFDAAFNHFKAANEVSNLQLARSRPTRAVRDRELAQVRAMFTQRFFDAHEAVGSQSEAPTLIVGMIRSGTTLVEQILSSHPHVAAGGEQHFLLRHSALQLKSESQIVEAAPAVRDAYAQLIAGIGRGKRLVTDKMPINFKILGLFHLMFPKGRIIHCLRNPADTSLSIYVTPFADPVDFAHDPDEIVAFYQLYQSYMAHWEAVLPTRQLLQVNYEDLVTNRETEVHRLLDFCGVPWDDACLEHQTRGGAVVTPSTWQVRQKVYSSSIGRWRHYDAWLPQFGKLNEPGINPGLRST